MFFLFAYVYMKKIFVACFQALVSLVRRSGCTSRSMWRPQLANTASHRFPQGAVHYWLGSHGSLSCPFHLLFFSRRLCFLLSSLSATCVVWFQQPAVIYNEHLVRTRSFDQASSFVLDREHESRSTLGRSERGWFNTFPSAREARLHIWQDSLRCIQVPWLLSC